MCNVQEILYEPYLEPSVPKKTSNTLYGDGWWKPLDHLNFVPINLNTLTRDTVIQHNTLFHHEVALLSI